MLLIFEEIMNSIQYCIVVHAVVTVRDEKSPAKAGKIEIKCIGFHVFSHGFATLSPPRLSHELVSARQSQYISMYNYH